MISSRHQREARHAKRFDEMLATPPDYWENEIPESYIEDAMFQQLMDADRYEEQLQNLSESPEGRQAAADLYEACYSGTRSDKEIAIHAKYLMRKLEESTRKSVIENVNS